MRGAKRPRALHEGSFLYETHNVFGGVLRAHHECMGVVQHHEVRHPGEPRRLHPEDAVIGPLIEPAVALVAGDDPELRSRYGEGRVEAGVREPPAALAGDPTVEPPVREAPGQPGRAIGRGQHDDPAEPRWVAASETVADDHVAQGVSDEVIAPAAPRAYGLLEPGGDVV